MQTGNWTVDVRPTTGNYGFAIKPTVRASYAYRVVFQSDGDHATAVSPTKAFRVS